MANAPGCLYPYLIELTLVLAMNFRTRVECSNLIYSRFIFFLKKC